MEFLKYFQLRIQASDKGFPVRVNTMTMYVDVKRSTSPPQFEGLPYNTKIIKETLEVGRSVFQTRAHDPDRRVKTQQI